MSAPRDSDTTQPIPRLGRAGDERRRALLVLGVLAVIAVGIVGIMVAVLGGSNGGGPIAQSTNQFTGPPVTHLNSGAPSHPGGSQSTSGSTTTQSQTSQPATSQSPSGPNNRPVSCPTSGPCPLPDDIGDVLGALNSYRQQHGLGPVGGRVTPAAATCAVTAASECPNGYHWEPVGRSGRQVIEKIAARGGDDFLLNPQLKRVQIGWAYVPASHSFYCALVAPGT